MVEPTLPRIDGPAAQRATAETSSAVSGASQHVLDRDEAAELIERAYLPVRFLPLRGAGEFGMHVATLPMGTMTAGVVGLVTNTRTVSSEAAQFHLNLTLRGRAASRRSGGEPMVTEPGRGVLFGPGDVADVVWFDNCEQLCLMIPRDTLESELEALLGRAVKAPLSFAPALELDGRLSRLLSPAIQMMVSELHSPAFASRFPVVGRHLEGLVLDGLLLGHRHNYSELVERPVSAARLPVRRAVELLEARPEHPWTTVGLAQEVHLSVRALQEGFRRHHDLPPMAYLREVRLRRSHRMLLEAHPGSILVQDVALRLGFVHLGRFSTTYRQRYGESPSATLARLPS